MDSAVVVGSVPQWVVSGQELRAWDQALVETTKFRCQGCSVAMVPRAFKLRSTDLYVSGRCGIDEMPCLSGRMGLL
ncbi:hypothetical protein B1964_29195 [Gordonia sp. i37]|nr:hypothetical protein B1964_29195 [Gordonia sp. i37]